MSILHFRTELRQIPLTRDPRFEPWASAALLPETRAAQFAEMEESFHSNGGIVSSDVILSMLSEHTDQPISLLARWIVKSEILAFSWDRRTLVPLFQFDLAAMTRRQPVSDVLGELVPVLNDWDIALWFVRPNVWLNDVAPVLVMSVDARAVHHAARAERYLSRS